MDQRIFVSNAGDSVVLVNYKCGFSTINNALVKGIENPDFHFTEHPREAVQAARRSVLFVREPASRLKSFFRNWVVSKTYQSADKQRGFEFAERWMQPKSFERLVSAPREEKNTAQFLEFFLQEIGPAIMYEGHLVPQWCLLSKFGIPLDQIGEVLSYRENIAFLEREFGINAEITNITRTEADGADPLDSDALEAFCQVIYARDYAMFRDFF